MPSTYSTSLRLELMGAGEQAGNWGNTTNYNLGTLLEQAIAGVENVAISGTSYTLTTGSGVADQARNAVINLTGTLSANCNVIVPSVDKVYTIRNSTAGGFSVVVKTAAGSGVTVANGLTQSMYCDATNVVASGVAFNNATNTIASNVTGNVTGNVSFGAGSAGSPGLSVTSDSDTGIFSAAANSLSISVGGDRLMDFYQSTALLQNKLGDAEANYWVRLGDASAVNVRACQYGALNENSIPLASFRSVLATDGSSNIELYATPAGSRASDRRVLRMNVPGSGQITMNGGLGLNAGTAAAPAYSFSGDTNTGIFSPGADQLAIATNGNQILQAFDGGLLFLGKPADNFSPIYLQNNGASGSQSKTLFLQARNESSIGVADVYFNVNSDGSSGIELYTTPAGSRASYRGALRLSIPGVGPVVVNSGGLDVLNDLRFNSGYGSAALAFGCRAWVNFNGTGTVAIRASGNVSSITDNGTGDYTVNFTTNMPDANYAPMVVIEQSGVAGGSATEAASISSQTTSAFRFACKYSYSIFSAGATSNRYDPNTVSVTITR